MTCLEDIFWKGVGRLTKGISKVGQRESDCSSSEGIVFECLLVSSESRTEKVFIGRSLREAEESCWRVVRVIFR